MDFSKQPPKDETGKSSKNLPNLHDFGPKCWIFFGVKRTNQAPSSNHVGYVLEIGPLPVENEALGWNPRS